MTSRDVMSKISSPIPASPELVRELRSRRIRRNVAPLVMRLGGLRDVYEVKPIPFWLRFLGLFCLLLGLLILAAFWREYSLLFSWWPLVQVYTLLAVSILWLIFGLLITLLLALSTRLRVLVCANGLIYIKRKPIPVSWNDIELFWKQVRLQEKTRITYTYTIRTFEGARLVFPSELVEVERLGHMLERRVTRTRLPALLDAYDDGERLSFDLITLSREGISVQRPQVTRKKRKRSAHVSQDSQDVQHQMLPWDELERVTVNATSLSVYKRGQYWDWLTLPVALVPNALLLERMVESILREQREAPQQRNIHIYEAQLPVRFGDIRVSTQGLDIENGKISLPWCEIAGIGIGDQEVIIKRQGDVEEWYAIPLWRVGNARYLRDLVDDILQGR